MRFPLSRRHFFVSALALALFAAWGCSKKETPVPVVPPSISQADADDIAQQIGIMTSVDNGGWFTMLESLNAMLPGILANTQAFTGGRSRPTSATFLPRPSLLEDTTFAKAAVNYSWSIVYFHNSFMDSTGRPDTLSEVLGANVIGAGSLNAGGVSGTYGLFPDFSKAVEIYNLDTSNDTLQFSAFFDDSSYALVSSTITTGQSRLWYVQNTIDYDLTLLKSQVPASPYDLKGIVRWDFIDASIIATPPSRTDFASSGQAFGEMTLTGAQDATLEITDILGAAVYRYRMNLKTGAITRL
jgi:hypothetical protein